MYYDAGTPAAVDAFAAEAKAGNPAFPDAKRALETLFSAEHSPGPVKAAHFVFGPPSASDSADFRTRRQLCPSSSAKRGSMVCGWMR